MYAHKYIDGKPDVKADDRDERRREEKRWSERNVNSPVAGTYLRYYHGRKQSIRRLKLREESSLTWRNRATGQALITQMQIDSAHYHSNNDRIQARKSHAAKGAARFISLV